MHYQSFLKGLIPLSPLVHYTRAEVIGVVSLLLLLLLLVIVIVWNETIWYICDVGRVYSVCRLLLLGDGVGVLKDRGRICR